ncbi:MAG: ATP-dependent DNA helicase [Planctomycetota bacterium]
MDEPPHHDEELAGLLGPQGPVASALEGEGAAYETRAEQLQMAAAVAASLSSSRHLIVEAGTGVGKSFAYLVPLLRHAVNAGCTVAVATSTIALQEQLVQRDLPLLQRALPFDVSFALVKGRGNYLCTRRMLLACADARTLGDERLRAQLDAIRAWARRTQEGSRQDLPFRPAPEVWDGVRAEQGNCKGRACPHYEPCHYQRSRRRAHAVDCLVLNHHVLMADLALRRSGASFLPRVDAVLIDEAHDLEDTAAEHLGLRGSSAGTLMLLGRLWQPARRRGLLARLEDDGLRKQVDRTRVVARAVFEDLSRQAPAGGTVRLADGFPVEDTLSPRLRDLADAVERGAPAAPDEDLAMELVARGRGLLDAAETLEEIVRPRPGDVRGLERRRQGVPAGCSTPVDVGPLLREVLWDAHPSVILTSATLATGRPPSFAYLRGRLGLEDADALSVGSPFDYVRQARIVVHRDVPDPARSPEAYDAALPPAVLSSVRRTHGGAFVLFTSYDSMRRTADALRSDLEADGLEVLVQGEDLERAALLERFRRGDAVLFGVSSFWQGVDVPGDALRHVVIARLPFDVPTHPLQQARRERLEARGGDAFRHLTLPTAALRLKQGFGRLIRNTTDEGTVSILDPRIVTRSYGRVLLESLPECPVELEGE